MPRSASELVLLLHGQPGGARDWDRVRAIIGRRARMLAIDRPGWKPGSAPTDLAGNAAAAVAALDLEGAERALVVGHSLGGAVAAWLAADFPDRVSGLVLAAPAANCASLVPLDHWLARPLAGEVVGAPVLAGAGLVLSVAPVRRRLAGLLALEDNYLEVTGRGLLSPGAWRAFAADQRALVRDLPALEERLGRISAPTIVVNGGADRIVPPASARALAETIPGAEFRLLRRAGHLLLQRQAAQMAEIILEALQAS